MSILWRYTATKYSSLSITCTALAELLLWHLQLNRPAPRSAPHNTGTGILTSTAQCCRITSSCPFYENSLTVNASDLTQYRG
ncbi:hypothetical protein HOY80DRAFT_179926 [Tuber brumale]|nr:hypothetical protein HOY80DRAFT_179926 [Tuber brumale]